MRKIPAPVLILVISMPMPSPKTTRQETITTASQRVFCIAGQNFGRSEKTYVQFSTPRQVGGLRPSYRMNEKYSVETSG